MAIIVRAYSEIDGQVGFASSINRVIDDLYSLQAGSIDGSNIAASGILAANIATSAVVSRTINNQAVDFDKLDYQAILACEVFI